MNHQPAKLCINGISKFFQRRDGQRFQALADISLTLAEGELLSLIGHSGCGKSTLLNIVAGLESADAGHISVDGQKRVGPGKDRGMVFQSYTLFPWLTVKQNVAFGLRMAGIAKAERERVAEYYLDMVELSRFADDFPKQLSGGMRQRVALARALANKPAVLLMDEPFGALDAETREHMHNLLMQVRAHESMTVLFITHDIDEAIFLSNRIGILAPNPGRLVDEYAINFTQPRSADTKLSQEFFEHKREVIRRFQRSHGVTHG